MFRKFYYGFHNYLRGRAPRLYEIIYRKKSAAKYIFSGGMATITNLLILYVLVEFLGVHYLIASTAAFVVSIAVSFTMQKFWTFEDSSKDNIHAQFAFYLAVVLFNLALNTFLVYASVEWLHIWYFMAQFIAGAIIALISFFAYRNMVFKR